MLRATHRILENPMSEIVKVLEVIAESDKSFDENSTMPSAARRKRPEHMNTGVVFANTSPEA